MADSGSAVSDEQVREFLLIENEFAAIDGLLRTRRGRRSDTVLLQTHPRSNSYANMSAYPCADVAALGVDTFAFNNRFTNSAAGIDVSTVWEPLALDVAAAIKAMRERGYANVILYGWSAGGPLVAFYQNVAEHGNEVFRKGDTLGGFEGFVDAGGGELRLPPADALIMQNATSGTGSSFLLRLDGSVLDEAEGVRDPSLDMYEPSNGYDPSTGCATYSDEFLERYHAAQAARMNRLIRVSQERLDALRQIGRPFTDDAFIVVPGVRAAPAFVDARQGSHSQAAWPVLPGGDVTRPRSSRRMLTNSARSNVTRAEGSTVHTLTSFLSYRAVAVDAGRYRPFSSSAAELGVHGHTSNTSTWTNIERTTVPLFVTAGTADVEVHIPTAELIFNSATCDDKELVFIQGADHGMRTDGVADRRTHLEAVQRWLSDHGFAQATMPATGGAV